MSKQHDPTKVKPPIIAYWKVWAGVGIVLWAVALEVDMYYLTRTPEYKQMYGEVDSVFDFFRKFWSGEYRRQIDETNKKREEERQKKMERFEQLMRAAEERRQEQSNE
eukprot:TRINITY_DN1270_c0_g1_i1.p2 TRINITY_DN1270_c0_g1~~TRINITY_DN1270_c0_g1_i1.p2  ORF type:complete len:108 (-),score=21.65 TRINITY_DN1270_c0_g1_i1:193-516(-)